MGAIAAMYLGMRISSGYTRVRFVDAVIVDADEHVLNKVFEIRRHPTFKNSAVFSAKVNSTTIIVTFLATMKIEQKRLQENL